jgi:hypothetical protein
LESLKRGVIGDLANGTTTEVEESVHPMVNARAPVPPRRTGLHLGPVEQLKPGEVVTLIGADKYPELAH